MNDIIFTDRKKIRSLQAVRAMAFLGIFLFHSGVTAFSAGGVWGVSVFFILSGFLMFYSYSGTDKIKECGIIYNLKFGVNKIKKLYLLHIVTMILAMPWIVKAIISGDILTSVIKTVLNICLLQSWIPSADIYFSLNGVSWYLSVSLFLYAMFPFVLRQIEKYDRIQNAIAAILIIYFLQIMMFFAVYCVQTELFHDNALAHWFVYVFPLSRLGDFVIGCNLGYVFLNSTGKDCFDRKMSTAMEGGVSLLF